MELVERYYDYILSSGSLTTGQISLPLQIPINADAPFLLRARGATNAQGGGLLVSTRFADANRRYRTNNQFVNMEADIPKQGEGALFHPVYPPILYPANSNLEFQVRNDWTGTQTWWNIFRGVTLHPKGSVYAPDRPLKFEVLRYSYVLELAIARAATATVLRDQFLNIKPDADFMWTDSFVRSDQSQGLGFFNDLRVRFKDRLGKYYSSDFIPVDLVIGTDQAFFGIGDQSQPCVFYPGIYLKANDYMAFDFQLNDTGGAATLNFEFVLNGYKVFPR